MKPSAHCCTGQRASSVNGLNLNQRVKEARAKNAAAGRGANPIWSIPRAQWILGILVENIKIKDFFPLLCE